MGDDKRKPNGKLRHARELRGWSQRYVAAQVGTTEHVVSRWESGQHKPNRYFQTELCKLFGMNAEELGFMSTREQEEISPRLKASQPPPSEQLLSSANYRSSQPFPNSPFVQGIFPSPQGILMEEQEVGNLMDLFRRKLLQDTGALLFPLFFTSKQRSTAEMALHGSSIIQACWNLMKGKEIGAAEEILSAYTPIWLSLTFQPSPHQQAIAQVATQACMMRAIIANHRLNLIAREMYCHEAIQCSRISGDKVLHAEALSYLAWTYLYCRPPRPQQGIEALRAALKELGDTDNLVKSDICLGLADAYALVNDESQAKRAIHLAQDCFPSHPEQCTSFLYVDISQGTLYNWESKVYLDLARHSQQQEYYQRAQDVLERSARTQARSERSTLETVIYQGTTALGLRDLDAYTSHLKEGVSTALQIGSQRRYQEALDLYREAPENWKQEPQMKNLAAFFREQRRQEK